MTIRDGLKEIVKDGKTSHKALGNDVKILDSDWIRVYKGTHGCIHSMIYNCDYNDIDLIPNEILDIEYDEQTNWMVGGDLSLDFVVYEK